MRSWIPLAALTLAIAGAGGFVMGRGARERSPGPTSAVGSAPARRPRAPGAIDFTPPEPPAKPARQLAPAPAPAPSSSPASTERDQYVQTFRASGPDEHRLLDRARAAGDAWSKIAEDDALARFDTWECHRAGCFGSVVHASAASVETVTDKVTKTPEFNTWSAEKFRSGPIARADGTVEVTWFLYSPNETAGPAENAPGEDTGHEGR